MAGENEEQCGGDDDYAAYQQPGSRGDGRGRDRFSGWCQHLDVVLLHNGDFGCGGRGIGSFDRRRRSGGIGLWVNGDQLYFWYLTGREVLAVRFVQTKPNVAVSLPVGDVAPGVPLLINENGGNLNETRKKKA